MDETIEKELASIDNQTTRTEYVVKAMKEHVTKASESTFTSLDSRYHAIAASANTLKSVASARSMGG